MTQCGTRAPHWRGEIPKREGSSCPGSFAPKFFAACHPATVPTANSRRRLAARIENGQALSQCKRARSTKRNSSASDYVLIMSTQKGLVVEPRPSCGGDPADGAPGSGRREPKYGAPAGLTENRFRPETPATPSAGALFFNRGPNLLDPLPNSVFVPLDGFARRFLRAPVHGVQQSTNVIHVIAHTEAALDVLGDPRTGPQIGAESRRLRTSQQLLLQLLALLRRQFRRSSAGWNGSESSFASAALGTLPTADAARVNLEDAGDFSLRQALLEQIDGALTFALQLFRTALRSDRSPPHHQSSIGHYLCRNQ